MESKKIRITPENEHFFFGYYNISPWNKKEDKILGARARFINRHPEKDDALELGYFENKNFIKIDETNAWNWQQGCLMQWLPGSNTKIIYNKREKGRFISVVYDIIKKSKKKNPFPIYSLHPSGKYALSLNFSRLNDVRRGYGYEGLKDKFEKEKIPEKDGIYFANLKSGKQKLIISTKKLSSIFPEESMKYGKHWVNHLSFNDAGDRFCFFYRWELPDELFNTRLITSDLEGKKIKVLAKGGTFSHVEWINDKELLGWGSMSKSIQHIKSDTKKTKFFFRIIRPIAKKILPQSLRNKITKQGYLIFNDLDGEIKSTKILNFDGHPTISPNKNFILTDSYADKKHFRKLLLVNLKNKKIDLLGKFYSLPSAKYANQKDWDNSGLRCDLHPRWSPKGDKICFDSVHEGFRGIYISNL